MQGTADTFICVECDRQRGADTLAFDTDPEHRLGVCTDCEPSVAAAQVMPAWMGREVA